MIAVGLFAEEDKLEGFSKYAGQLKKKPFKGLTGVLKFFFDQKNYGFIVSEHEGSKYQIGDVFFYYDDIKDTKLSKEFLRDAKNKYLIKLSFTL